MNDYINAQLDDGRNVKIEVINIFSLEKYPGKDYIMYSMGEIVEGDNEKVYISILRGEKDSFYLDNIKDDVEWQDVQNAIKNFEQENGDVSE